MRVASAPAHTPPTNNSVFMWFDGGEWTSRGVRPPAAGEAPGLVIPPEEAVNACMVASTFARSVQIIITTVHSYILVKWMINMLITEDIL